MGSQSLVEMDAWLRQGGVVITASERATRALSSAFHRARRAEGLTAWPAPNIVDWNGFVRAAWLERTLDSRLLLNATQEQALWAGIASSGGHLATVLPGPLQRLAAMAMEAHGLVCSYAPRLLRSQTRAGWQGDPAEFSRWLSDFDEVCHRKNLLSAARLPVELIGLMRNEAAAAGARPPLRLAGFDRMTLTQRAVFDAWGDWREMRLDEPAAEVHFHQAQDDQAELSACAIWCSRVLESAPEARIVVVTQDASTRRGAIEREFLKHIPDGSFAAPLFEFSLGTPLGQVPLAHAATLLLRWLIGPVAEHELDWLFSSGHAAATAEETAALQAHMRALRRRNLEQPEWTPQAFVETRSSESFASVVPTPWIARVRKAQSRLSDAGRRPQSPLAWAELVPRLLADLAWPGAYPLSSAQFQADRRLQQAVEAAGSLGFDGRRIDWKEFLSGLGRTIDETLFAPESRDAPIQITGPAESAGLTADALWFLGANEEAWPATSLTHPLLPAEVQREAAMPHSTAKLDWQLAQAISTRLLGSAAQVHFSYAKQASGTAARPSRLIIQLAGEPQPMPPEFMAARNPEPLTERFDDASLIPFPRGRIAGGSDVLTNQSLCPFKAFVTARLDAQGWNAAEAGLTAAQRGQLLHAVMHSVWGGAPQGIRTSDELQAVVQSGLGAFVNGHVERALREKVRVAARGRMPARYLQLEADRLTRLVTEWLTYEAGRTQFTVVETEFAKTADVEGLTLKLRLDRIDRLIDNTLLVVDYKSGDVKPKLWDLPRPEDVQLPLYARYGLDADSELGGLVFAKIRPGESCFAGRVGDAKVTLLPNLSNSSGLVKDKLTAEQVIDWQEEIERLARDFLAGHAEVDPRDYPRTCERCGLQALCRIQEHRDLVESEEEGDGAELDGGDDD